MIVILQPQAEKNEINQLRNSIECKGVEVSKVVGRDLTILGLIGDTANLSISDISKYHIVKNVVNVQEPYKKANRMFHPEDTTIDVNAIKIGGSSLGIIAGPCSVETEEQIVEIARRVKTAGANFLRGGAFKPRSSPYSFQGLELEGLRLLKIAKEETGLPIVSEITSSKYLDEFLESVDVIQIGTRNMQNFDLLKEVGKTQKPILLKEAYLPPLRSG